MSNENFILKKIRYYQATVSDYETFWNEKIKESQSETSDDTKKLKKHFTFFCVCDKILAYRLRELNSFFRFSKLENWQICMEEKV